jgi:hypothetical protein
VSSNDDSGGAPDLSQHPLVSKLHPDPDDHGAEHATFTGYLGPSSKDGHHRIYLDESFSNYVEVPEDAIVATASTDSDDENAPTRVTVNGSAAVRHVNVTSRLGSASYLSGAIASTHLAAGARASGGAPMPLCITLYTHSPTYCSPRMCPTTYTLRPTCAGDICLTVVTANPTDCGGPCPTYVTANPTDCTGPCLTVVTANPTDCSGPCPTYVTAVPSCDATAAAAARPCSTRVTALPTCQTGPQHTCMLTIYTANVTICARGGGRQICATYMTSNPTYCQAVALPPCTPILTYVPTYWQSCKEQYATSVTICSSPC